MTSIPDSSSTATLPAISAQTDDGATTSLRWKSIETYEQGTRNRIEILSILEDWTVKEVRTWVGTIVDNLTIDSELLKDDLRKEMLVIDAAYGRFLKRQITTQYLWPLHTQSMAESNSRLTIFEGRFIPLLLTDEIEGGRDRARRIHWKQLDTEQEQLDFLMSLLNLVREGKYEEPEFTNIEKTEAGSLKRVWSGDPYFVELGQSLASLLGYQPRRSSITSVHQQ